MTDTDITTTGQPMIRLDAVTKSYPGHAKEAICDLSLDINAGEILVLVGPSGCGKTATMRLINRLIKPTAGQIFLDGEDVTKVDPDQLRRRLGYVIQQVGLFPHMTIADNIELIPHTLGWDKHRIRNCVDEPLNLVGLDAQTYRSRYPKQLSGGQQQRVGVARALAADPPVMLMDEPFGAIDPITRDRLQDEFLRLQERIRKTIVIVTHDIQEAVKLVIESPSSTTTAKWPSSTPRPGSSPSPPTTSSPLSSAPEPRYAGSGSNESIPWRCSR